jgi:Ceramidase
MLSALPRSAALAANVNQQVLWMSQRPVSDQNTRRFIVLAVGLAAIFSLFLFDRVPQDARYHFFADTDTVGGVPNFWNLTSNWPFLIVGAFALWRLPRLTVRECWPAYSVLSVGIMLVGFGSVYYHYAPSTQTLFWDRLPMTVAFMGLFSLVLGERVISDYRNTTLVFLVTCGIAAVLYWSWTEANGRGDLRPYAVVQFLPLILMPLILALFPRKYLDSRLLIGALAWYLLAKVLEHYDHQILNLLGVIGGHPLKHIAAAIGALCLVCAVPVAPRDKSPKRTGLVGPALPL